MAFQLAAITCEIAGTSLVEAIGVAVINLDGRPGQT